MERKITARVLVSLLLALPLAALRAETEGFKDPAPPQVHALAPMPEPKPVAQPELKFHAAPRPLAPGAVTHDWRTFLGPTHNAVSTERPLLKRFGPKGPRLVWEVSRGEGYATPAVVGQRVVLFHRVGGQEIVECLHA